jgi:sporulation protein YlmC with PRC-barrel domain
MLNSISHLSGAKVTATDGDIGHVKDAFFDDRSWTIRYLVVDAGTWLTGREVLISPYAVKQPVGSDKHIHVALTQQQVRDSPDVDTHQPVSRQHERDYLRYYGYPEYWDGGGLWAMGAMPYPPIWAPATDEAAANRAMMERDFRAGDSHLRSSDSVTGYDIQASDDGIGQVQDYVFDDASWAIRYLIVDTRKWWPGGRKVLVGMNWVDRIDWATKKVHVHMTVEQLKSSPAFEDVGSIHREYEMRLHDNVKRPGYWV